MTTMFRKLVIRCEGCEADYAAPDNARNFCSACEKRWQETELRKDKPNPFYSPRA